MMDILIKGGVVGVPRYRADSGTCRLCKKGGKNMITVNCIKYSSAIRSTCYRDSFYLLADRCTLHLADGRSL